MKTEKIQLPSGILGTTSELTVYRFGAGRPKVYIQAGLHADEWTGMAVITELFKRLEALENEQKIIGEITIVPIANPIGLRQFLGGFQVGRFDWDYSGNFNRGYVDLAQKALPKIDKKALSGWDKAGKIAYLREKLKEALAQWSVELEADYLRKTLFNLALDADYVLDCHCDAQACLHLFANYYHENLAKKLSAFLGAKVLLLEESTGVIAFDEALAGIWWKLGQALDCPEINDAVFATTLEYRGERDVFVESPADAENLIQFFTHIEVIAGEKALPKYDEAFSVSLNSVARINAQQSGLVEYLIQTGERVEKNQALCRIHNMTDLSASPKTYFAPCAGIIYALGRNHFTKSGHVLVQIAGENYSGTGTLTF